MTKRERRDADGRTTSQRAMLAVRTVQGSVRAQAAAAGLKTTHIARARYIQTNAAAELADVVAAGPLSLYAAFAILKYRPERAQHVAALEQVLDAPANVPVAVTLGAEARPRRPPVRRRAPLGPKRPVAWRLERALDALDNAIETVGHFADQPDARAADAVPKWIGRLRNQRAALFTCTRMLLGRRRL